MEKRSVSQQRLREAVDEFLERGDQRARVSVGKSVSIPVVALLTEVEEATGADTVELVDECEEDIPFAPMWIRRTPDGTVLRVCGHSPEHVTLLSSQP